jgi:hypothetical protein
MALENPPELQSLVRQIDVLCLLKLKHNIFNHFELLMVEMRAVCTIDETRCCDQKQLWRDLALYLS